MRRKQEDEPHEDEVGGQRGGSAAAWRRGLFCQCFSTETTLCSHYFSTMTSLHCNCCKNVCIAVGPFWCLCYIAITGLPLLLSQLFSTNRFSDNACLHLTLHSPFTSVHWIFAFVSITTRSSVSLTRRYYISGPRGWTPNLRLRRVPDACPLILALLCPLHSPLQAHSAVLITARVSTTVHSSVLITSRSSDPTFNIISYTLDIPPLPAIRWTMLRACHS
jgi:hypothetical protein